jgi:hypothetical protein
VYLHFFQKIKIFVKPAGPTGWPVARRARARTGRPVRARPGGLFFGPGRPGLSRAGWPVGKPDRRPSNFRKIPYFNMKSFWNFLWKTNFLPFNDNKKLRYMNYHIWYNFWVMWEWDRVILIKFINKNWFKNWILQRFVIWISNRIWIWNLDFKPVWNLKTGF